MAPQFLAARIANKHNQPFVLTTHAMLQPWFWTRNGLLAYAKKRVYWQVFAKARFAKASCLHAITAAERDVLHGMFPRAEIRLLPNVIDLNDVPEGNAANLERMILFLGRIDPQKGVDALVSAFDRAALRDWKLVIAGPEGPPEYCRRIREQIRNSRTAKQIELRGPVFGAAKWDLLRTAWVLAAPSHIEVIGMVNLEAAACRVPTITTSATGLEDWNESGGVMIPQPEVTELTDALKRVCSWSEEERKSLGAAMRRLIERKYSWEVVMPNWIELYTSLVNSA